MAKVIDSMEIGRGERITLLENLLTDNSATYAIEIDQGKARIRLECVTENDALNLMKQLYNSVA